MFTEQSLHDHPSLVKAFTGIDAEQFWKLIEQMHERLPNYNQQRLKRAERQRACGGGRHNDLSLVIRTMLVLTYLRLHIPQTVVAALSGATQSDVSRELRRLLALITSCLPCPVVWQLADQLDSQPADQLALASLHESRVLIDATEQRVYRPKGRERQKVYYSGKKAAHTQNPSGQRWRAFPARDQRGGWWSNPRQGALRPTCDPRTLARWL